MRKLHAIPASRELTGLNKRLTPISTFRPKIRSTRGYLRTYQAVRRTCRKADLNEAAARRTRSRVAERADLALR